ncbi:unnamed protein product [Adineta steineri]|uniref:Leucine rich repeat containing protein n=2 Tax=Adineta steineri TaxID=433720 RepID=A0A815G1M2_9BILA|nr:unnamed protein product [Adineta steineri]CAF1589855.1 unnamed protein product [Adineta steineri]
MKVPTRVSLNRHNNTEEKNDYANFSHTRLITLLQIPQFEHLQILICNGNSLTTLAGIENIKHLWKLDVGNNQIRSLQHLSRFIALGSLILSNNNLTWIEFQHIRHMFILDLRTDGNPALDTDPNYRQHILDCLPRVWMCDGVFVSTVERNQVDEFFTQSSLTQKPVRRKLVRDAFMPTNLKDRSVNGLFGSKATELLAKFPMNCFVNPELDRKRIKHLASTIQDLSLTEMKYQPEKRHLEFLTENRHNLYRMIDLREAHIEEFNMLLILLVTDLLFKIPDELLDNVMDVTHIKSIGNLNIAHVFSSDDQLKLMIASLVHASARIDRDENHPSAFYDKLFNSLSIVLTNQMRQFSSSNTNQNNGLISEAKSIVCLEVMQVFIMCPLFYTLIDDSNVNSIMKQALGRSPAYGSIKDVLQSFVADQKTAEEQKDLLSPILGNILKMTIRTLSTKRMKKTKETFSIGNEPMIPDNENLNQRVQEEHKLPPKPAQRASTHHVPDLETLCSIYFSAIGDRVLTAPQCFGRIVTIPDTEIAMIQFDNILSVNGAMISNGSFIDHTNYIHMSDFEWDLSHEYWKPKYASGDKITLQMTAHRNETPRVVPSPEPPPPRLPSPSKRMQLRTPESVEKECVTPKLFEINLHKPKEIFILPSRDISPQPSPLPPRNDHMDTNNSSRRTSKSPSPTPSIHERLSVTPEKVRLERPMSVRIIKQKQEQQMKSSTNGETISTAPVLIESTLFFMPDQCQTPIVSYEQMHQPSNLSTTMNDSEPQPPPPRFISAFEHSSILRSSSSAHHRTSIQRVPVPVHNVSQWFNGPDMKNERSGRNEKVVASLVHRSYRPLSSYSMPRVPTLTSPSSRDHAQYKGTRPGTSYDFSVESHRMTTTPFINARQSQSAKKRSTPSMHSHETNRTTHINPPINRVKSLLNPPCPSPAWM